MILRLLKDRGMVSGLFEKKRDAIPPHLKHYLYNVCRRRDRGSCLILPAAIFAVTQKIAQTQRSAL
jgi:hypothetical protein